MSFAFDRDAYPKTPVTASKDLERILVTPTRHEVHELEGGRWTPSLDGLTPTEVTAFFQKPGGKMTLKPLQARALVEAARARGLVGRIPVGEGKTLVSLLLPEVLQARRALLLVPAALMGSLQREVAKYEPHFRLGLDRIVRIMSHQELSLPSSTALLDALAPDAVIIDEVDAFANRESVRTDRLFKYGRKHALRWGVLSGTLFQKSVKDALYWFALTLRERSPLPLQRSEIETWVDVLDPLELGGQVRDAGALRRLCEPGETPRAAWNRKAAATVGVVTSKDRRLGVSLNIHERPLEMPEPLRLTLREVQRTWTRPDGKEFSMALDLRRLERQVSAGFFYRWLVEPEPEWLEARNGWAAAVRRRLQSVRRVGMDSPHLVELAAEREVLLDAGQLPASEADLPHFDSPEWRRWRGLRHIPEPETVAVDLDPYLHFDAAAWGREHVGIIWALHEHTGRRIAAAGGFPFYGAGDDGILDERGNRTVVASIKAHGVGKNLQRFCQMLVTELPASGRAWEQLLGRLHREGQDSPQVDVWIYRHCSAYTRAWATAQRKARFMQDMNGNDQKLLHATCTFDVEQVDQGAIDSLSFTPEELRVMDSLADGDDLAS